MKYQDQMGNTLYFPHLPQRIISLVPSQTELLFDLGLDREVVGITRYCIYPEARCQRKIRIGGTKKFNFERIEQLQPDLIIGNKEENYREGIQRLQKRYPVWMSDITTVEDALEMLRMLGLLVNRETQANALIQEIQHSLSHLPAFPLKKAAYFIWKNPYMAVGKDTFIHHMLQYCGFENVFAALARYPEISLERLKQARPEIILLSSEPFPFQQEDADALKAELPTAKVLRVDGTPFSWYGSRLRYAAAYFTRLRTE